MIQVHLAWNDDGGNFSGELFRVELHDASGHLVTLEIGLLEGEGLPVEFDRQGDGCEIRLIDGGRASAYRGSTYRRWVGNMAWDQVQMEREAAIAFARELVSLGACITEHVCEPPWDELDPDDEEAPHA